MLRGGEQIGAVTSGNYSPVLGHGIALALVYSASGAAVGDAVEIEVRGSRLAGAIVPTPFVGR